MSVVPFFLSFDPFSVDLFLIPEKVLFLKILALPPGRNPVAAPDTICIQQEQTALRSKVIDKKKDK